MDTIINVGLLLLGFLGAVAAIGGDTWRKGNERVLRRITKRGWISIVALSLTLSLGVMKEFRSRAAAVNASQAAEELQRKLDTANDHLAKAESSRNELSEKMEEAQRSLAALEPGILEAMFQLTERIIREQDFAFVQLNGKHEVIPISSETKSPLLLYGGDVFEYSLFCHGSFNRRNLALHAGARDYEIRRNHDEIRISGPIGVPLRAVIINRERLKDCGMKIIVKSTDRTRTRQQFDSLLRKIDEAKKALK